jgi:preprotein translocase subunit SecA
MLTYLARKVFGTRNDRVLKSFRPIVHEINKLEESFAALSDDELRAKTDQFRAQYAEGRTLDELLPEAFATVREAAKRVLGMRHFDVQLIGGMVLHRGMIAEMKTGEGKTLMATLPAYLNALAGKGVHIVTVNDYLARRDAEWMGRVYRALGLSVGVVFSGMDEQEKKVAYRSDITYGQNNEFGFDYLRDNMKFSADDQFQRDHFFAIVDEVDSILIDEARTPLIISGPAESPTDLYYQLNTVIPRLQVGKDYEVELRTKSPSLTETGIATCERLLEIKNLYDPNNIDILHHLNQALKAHTTMQRDVDYVVREGQVVIVDEFTGRLMPGRRWSNGLHQAVEAKEGLKIMRENITLASITFQNFFRMYSKLSGMTGTADTEAVEFKTIYGLEVVVVPPNKPLARADLSDVVYRSRREKYNAVVADIKEIHQTGQPVLVGTVSIDQSEALSRLLHEEGIPHNVLNAKHHEREAEIVAQAGRFKSVTISTNMAGRGTDIVLGGNASFLAAAEAGTKERDDVRYQSAFTKYSQICLSEKEKVLAAGGLFIIGTERHESRRIDNQLRGRSGRQGDPGASRFYISLEDDLMLRFAGDRIQAIMNRMQWEEGTAMEGGLISRSIETAQKRVEDMHFESRKHVTEYDDVMNKQRRVIYSLRNKILLCEGIRDEIHSMLEDIAEDLVMAVCTVDKKPMEWDLNNLRERFTFITNHSLEGGDTIQLEQQVVYDWVYGALRALYDEQVRQKEEKLAGLVSLSTGDAPRIQFEQQIPSYADIEQRTLLEGLDHFWNQHIQDMEELRDGIGLRGYAQQNPLYEYQKEGFILFQQLMANLREGVCRKLFFEEVIDPAALIEAIEQEEEKRRRREGSIQTVHEATLADAGGASNDGEGDKSKKAPSSSATNQSRLRR